MNTVRGSQGFGLLEIILVIALVIGAGAASFTVFKSAQASSEASQAAQQLNLVAANVRNFLAFNHNTPHRGIDLLSDRPSASWVKLGIIPPVLVWPTNVPAPCCLTPAGKIGSGPVYIVRCLGCSPPRVSISAAGLSDDVCFRLAALLINQYPNVGTKPYVFVDDSSSAVASTAVFATRCKASRVNNHSVSLFIDG